MDISNNKIEPKSLPKKKKKKNRCQFKGCKIKLKISDMACCNCKKRYCAAHRTKTQHNCPVVETIDKDALMRKNGLGGGGFKKIEAL